MDGLLCSRAALLRNATKIELISLQRSQSLRTSKIVPFRYVESPTNVSISITASLIELAQLSKEDSRIVGGEHTEQININLNLALLLRGCSVRCLYLRKILMHDILFGRGFFSSKISPLICITNRLKRNSSGFVCYLQARGSSLKCGCRIRQLVTSAAYRNMNICLIKSF